MFSLGSRTATKARARLCLIMKWFRVSSRCARRGERKCELRLGTGVTLQLTGRHRTAAETARFHRQLNRFVVKTPVITLSSSPFPPSTVAYRAVSLFARDSSYWRGSICRFSCIYSEVICSRHASREYFLRFRTMNRQWLYIARIG